MRSKQKSVLTTYIYFGTLETYLMIISLESVKIYLATKETQIN